MNWVGDAIQQHVSPDDTVLDLGCGIMQATSDTLTKGELKCKTILGVDVWPKYLDVIKSKYPTLKADATDTKFFVDGSFDVVMAIDVLEHLDFQAALNLISEMKRIARKKVIIYTPETFEENTENEQNAWGLGQNPYQIHRCVLPESLLVELGFAVTHPQIYRKIGPLRKKSGEKSNNFAVWTCHQ